MMQWVFYSVFPAKDVLGWTDADIALLTIWGGIVFAVAVIPLTSLMDKLGKI